MTGQDYEKAIVAHVCWSAMKSELYVGMSFLAMVLRNRSKAGWFEGSIYRNALAFAQETGISFTDWPDAREPNFLNLLSVIDGIYTGVVPDRTDGALYVAHKALSDTIAGERTAELGQHIFFRSTE